MISDHPHRYQSFRTLNKQCLWRQKVKKVHRSLVPNVEVWSQNVHIYQKCTLKSSVEIKSSVESFPDEMIQVAYIHCGTSSYTLCNMIEHLWNVLQCIYPMLPNVYVSYHCNTMYIHVCPPMYIYVIKCIYVCPNVCTCVPMYIRYIHWVTTLYTLGNKTHMHPNVYTVTQCT